MNHFKSSRRATAVLGAIATGFITLSVFQNCSNAKFGIDPSAKDSTLGAENVFPSGGNDGNVPVATPTPTSTPSNAGNNNGNDGNIGSGWPTGGGNDGGTGNHQHGGNDGNLGGGSCQHGSTSGGNDGATGPAGSLNLVCSNNASTNNPAQAVSNVISDSALKLEVYDSKQNFVCEITGDFRNEILSSESKTGSTITIVPCAAATAGNTYTAYLVDASLTISSISDAKSNSLVIQQASGSSPKAGISFTVTSSGTASIQGSYYIVFDLNDQESGYASLNTNGLSTPTTQQACQKNASPLLISFNGPSSKGIALTSQANGIEFDILGQRSTPVAHAPKQISWFLASSAPENYFVVLPDANGEVHGIDQMFGDNTMGPDGQYAANGYLALAKYDANHDGYITKADPIFSQLRLWKDANRDGIAQPSELFTLDDMEIVSIDLSYNSNYVETDAYGNQTRMKSVAQTADGRLHLMFDLWFRYYDLH